MNMIRYEIIIAFQENKENLEKTVKSCVEQLKENDRVIILCKEKKQELEKLKPVKKNKKRVLVKTVSDVPTGFNECVQESEAEFTIFMKEGDWLGEDFLEHAKQVMKDPEEQWIDEEKEDEVGEIMDPMAVDLLFPQNFCDNQLVSEKPKKHVFSKKAIHGTYGIDLDKHYELLQTALYGTLIRTKFLKNYQFNKEIYFEYDTDVLLRMLNDEKKYLVTDQIEYYYVDPKENQVLYHIPAHDPRWYQESMEQYLLPLLEEGDRSPFLQNYAVYYTLNRFLSNLDNRNKKQITDENSEEYFGLVKKVFDLIDDYYLLNQDQLGYLSKNPQILCMFLRIKYGISNVKYDYVNEVDEETGVEDLVMYYNGNRISSVNSHYFSITMMNYVDGKVWLDGSLISIFEQGNVEFFAEFNNEMIKVEDTDAYSLTKYFGIPAYRRITYHLELNLNPDLKKQQVRFYAKHGDKKYLLRITFSDHWAKLSKSPRYSYWRFNKYLCHHAEQAIVFKKANLYNVLKRETQLQINLLKINTKNSRYALRLRWIYWITRPYFKKKKIWLMLDKLYKGGDSCEYLYRYSAKLNDGVTRYYVIDKNTPDYKKLVKDGYKPLVTNSLMHKLAFLNADLVLITNSHLFPFNGFTKDKSKYFRGFCNFSSMCLQHGLSVQKCAMAQRRIIDNTTGYFLASKYEYENLSKHAYGYGGFDVLKMTGIGRYDGLISNDKKQILLSPTWRMYNALPVTTSEGEQRGYNPEFKNTTYYHVYNNLINHERLIECAKKTGYKIKFLLHPILSSQVDDFTPNSEVEVIPSVGNLSYEKILTESSLMVTDYSGVQFDFAYMRKPIVYFHPEELPPHYEDGIFFYDTMGFGEICTKTEQLVDLLCDYMEHGCKMKEKYVERADDFFEYDDHNNCERIYHEIMKSQAQIDKDKMRK